MTETGLLGPTGEMLPAIGSLGPDARAIIVNDTDLPDGPVEEAVMDLFVENASLAGVQPSSFQTYANNSGSLLARSKFTTPSSVIGEIKLARDLAERDDDVAAVIGSMLGIAFSEGMDNFHGDEATVAIFNKICEEANMDHVVQEFYREWLISGQINSATLFTRKVIEYLPAGLKTPVSNSVAMPVVGVLPAENIRVIGNDMFGMGELAYDPTDNPKLQEWLEAYFDPKISAAKKAELGREDRVSANMFTERREVDFNASDGTGRFQGTLYILNPRMVQRSTMPKGTWKYPRPPLCRDFALLEAKRLLNIMDFALLQGGSNFIIVAKKGSDQHRATKPEITNLAQQVRMASRTGVIVGDHRLTFDIITPELKELLNPQKRRLIGRKLAMALMRTPEQGTEEPGTEGAKLETEIFGRVVSLDRRDIKRHIENRIYPEVVKRNPSLLKDKAKLWFPQIVLTGGQFFTDFVLKLRDRGDIPRSWGTRVAGFPWEAGVQERRRELERGDDEVMQPGSVPFSEPGSPQDNQEGRPSGSKDGAGKDPAAPRRTIRKTAGETIKAMYDEELARVVRIGEITHAILEEYPDFEVGRFQRRERDAYERAEVHQVGPVLYVPVNMDRQTTREKMLRLDKGMSMVVGEIAGTGAIVAKMLCFHEHTYDERAAEDLSVRWGFGELPEPEPSE